MFSLKTRNHPCTGCEKAPGGCKHRCQTYRDYEQVMHEKVYPERAQHGSEARAQASTTCSGKWAAMRRAARSNTMRPVYVR
jgi:hypothetical protein